MQKFINVDGGSFRDSLGNLEGDDSKYGPPTLTAESLTNTQQNPPMYAGSSTSPTVSGDLQLSSINPLQSSALTSPEAREGLRQTSVATAGPSATKGKDKKVYKEPKTTKGSF